VVIFLALVWNRTAKTATGTAVRVG
jgi:hypothetical protein